MKLKLIQHEQHARLKTERSCGRRRFVKFLSIRVYRSSHFCRSVFAASNFCRSVFVASKILSIRVKNVDPCLPRQILSIRVKNVDPCLQRQILSIQVKNVDLCRERRFVIATSNFLSIRVCQASKASIRVCRVKFLSIRVENVDSCLPRQIFWRFVSAARHKRWSVLPRVKIFVDLCLQVDYRVFCTSKHQIIYRVLHYNINKFTQCCKLQQQHAAILVHLPSEEQIKDFKTYLLFYIWFTTSLYGKSGESLHLRSWPTLWFWFFHTIFCGKQIRNHMNENTLILL